MNPQMYTELAQRNQESLGDLFESLMGYAWWRKYRGGVQDLDEFSQLFRSELDIYWDESDFLQLWEVWQEHHTLETWTPWVEQLVSGAEVLMVQQPTRFLIRSRYADDYEWIRLAPHGNWLAP